MKKSISLSMLVAIAALAASCASAGLTASAHLTNVGLSSSNYRLVATNISGESFSKGVLGVSFGVGPGASQLSLIPLTPDRMLYKNAMKNLWANFELKNGSPMDRTLALVNMRYDVETFNIFFYTKIKVVVVADVVEFK